MRKLLLLFLAVLSPSCGGTSTVLFTGKNTVDDRLEFGVLSHKDIDRIKVVNPYIGFILPLPYAEDWVFQPSAKKPAFGKSDSLMMFVTLQRHHPGKQVEEEAYLRDEYLKNLKSSWEGRGVKFTDVAVARQGEHFVLEYVTHATLPDGRPFTQVHLWTFRQRPEGEICEVHLSTVQQSEPQRGELCAKLRRILGNEFLTPPSVSR